MEQRHEPRTARFDSENFEIEIRHLLFRRAKNLSISRQTSSPPEKPRQCIRIGADELETFIDRREEIIALSIDAIDEQRFDIGLHRCRTGFCLTSDSQAGKGRSDSVAPAGLGYSATIFSLGVL